MTPASRRFRRDRIPLTHSSVAFFGLCPGYTLVLHPYARLRGAHFPMFWPTRPFAKWTLPTRRLRAPFLRLPRVRRKQKIHTMTTSKKLKQMMMRKEP